MGSEAGEVAVRSVGSSSGLCRQGLVVKHVVVMDVHEHRHRLPDDERQPHGRVAVVATEEPAHYPGQRDLGTRACSQPTTVTMGWLPRAPNGRRGGPGAHLSHHAGESPETEHAQRDAHQVLGGGREGCQLAPRGHGTPAPGPRQGAHKALTSWKKAEARNTPVLATHLL